MAPGRAGQALFYPDVFVTCGPTSDKQHPKIIIEVVSESTEGYDLGGKFAAYRHPGEAGGIRAIHSRTRPGRSLPAPSRRLGPAAGPADGRLALHALGFECGVDAIYEDVDFATAS